ncbi:MAG: hypothetical protein ACE5Q6_12795 [Dehalococcoidia bacterium]
MGKFLVLAILATVLAACASATPTPEATPTAAPMPTAPQAEILLQATPSPAGKTSAGGSLIIIPPTVPAEVAVRLLTRTQVYDDTVFIDVSTDLPNGAVVDYAVREGEDGQGPREEVGTMNINSQQGTAEVDVSEWEGPLVKTEVAFRPWAEIQPGFIHRNFGKDGTKLVGDNVSTQGTKKLIESDSVLRFPTVREYRGRGNDIVGTFDLLPGVVTLFAQHSGQSEFQVQFVDSESSGGASLNGSGEYLGERAFPIKETIGEAGNNNSLQPGEYQLEVTADGPWLLELNQEFPTGGFVFPLGAEDVGDEVIRWLKLKEGRYRLQADHAGESSFVVELLNGQGGPSAQLINESGNFDGEAEINITTEPDQGVPPGFYALAVHADGHWNISVE